MEIQYRSESNTLYLIFKGDLDSFLDDSLYFFLENRRNKIKSLRLDMEHVRYINSNGIESLINIYNKFFEKTKKSVISDQDKMINSSEISKKRIIFLKMAPNIKEILDKIGLLNIDMEV